MYKVLFRPAVILGLACCLGCSSLPEPTEKVQEMVEHETKLDMRFYRVTPLGLEAPGYYVFNVFLFEARKEGLPTASMKFPPLADKISELLRSAPDKFVTPKGTTIIDGVSVDWERYPIMISEGTTTVTYSKDPNPVSLSITLDKENPEWDRMSFNLDFKWRKITRFLPDGRPLWSNRNISLSSAFKKEGSTVSTVGVIESGVPRFQHASRMEER